MSVIYSTKEGKYVKLSETPKTWVSGYDYRVSFVDNINQASVFGLQGERWLGQHQLEFRNVLGKIRDKYIPLKAELRIERKVLLVKVEENLDASDTDK